MSSDGPGMMSGAYFVGKRQLLEWVNEFLQLNYTKVEQMSTGCAHAQLVDAMFPGQLNLRRINFSPKHEHEFVRNWKPIQEIFNKNSVKKPIAVDKLVKGKYQDNFEFFQWMKSFFDQRYDGEPYNAVARRKKAGAKISRHESKLKRPSMSFGSPASASPSAASVAKTAAKTGTSPKKTPSRIGGLQRPSSLHRGASPGNAKKASRGGKTSGSGHHSATLDRTRRKGPPKGTRMEKKLWSENEALRDQLLAKDQEAVSKAEEFKKALEEANKANTMALQKIDEVKSALEARYQAKEDELKAMVEAKEATDAEKNVLSADLAVVRAELQESKKKFQDSIAESRTSAAGRIEKKDAEIATLKAEVAAKESEVEEAKESASGLNDKLKQEQKEREAQHASDAAKIQKLEADLQSAKSEVSQRDAEIKSGRQNFIMLVREHWWTVSAQEPPPAVKSTCTLFRVRMADTDDKHGNEDTHIVASVVDDEGKVMGRSARTPKGDTKAPLYVWLGGEGQNQGKWLFLQIKWAKRKGDVTKMSEQNFAFVELQEFLRKDRSPANPAPLKLYRKPTTFTRDPSKLKAAGKMNMRVAWEVLRPE